MLALINGMSSNLPPTDFPFSSKLLEEVSQELELQKAKKKHHHQKTQLQLLNNLNNLNAAVEQEEQHQHNRIQKQHLSEWKPEHFPHKMYDLLEDVERKGLDDIVSWCSDGKSFKIHSQIAFEQSIMPLYFSGMSSYKSFRRQLNLYGIYQHRHRPSQDANAYSREFLAKGHRHLCDLIGRKRANPATKSKAAKNGKKSSSSSPTTDIVVSAKNGKGDSKDSNVSMNKRDASVGRGTMDAKNHMNISATPNATTSTATTKRQMQSLEVELLQIQQLQLQRQQQESQALYNGGNQLQRVNNTHPTSNASTMKDLIRMNILMKLVHDDELLTRPNPIEYGNVRMALNSSNNVKDRSSSSINTSNRNHVNNNDTFRSFMGQCWEDLPNDLSSTQVVDEIITTFQQQQQQQQQQQHQQQR